MSRVAVLASGGVDSSVALLRLAEEGRHDLTAFYLKIWLEDDMAFLGSCPWEEDLEYVRQACDTAGIPLEVVSLQREYLDTVVAYALDELKSGHTPSPDVMCNRMIKFGAFVDRIGERFDFVASGHHARVGARDGLARLLRAADAHKDQTYFLCQLRQDQLVRSLFPIGDLTKAQVRDEARRLGLANADRPDSQGICFLGRVPFDDFVHHHLGERPGEIREAVTGELLGTHRGTWFHTIGQRRGLGLGSGPWYVVDKDHPNNIVTVVHADRLAQFQRRHFRIPLPHWIAGPPSASRLEVKIRHGQHMDPCTAVFDDDGGLSVELVGTQDPGIAPGQFAALYDGEECLGGGVME
ncbi:MAG: tRNA 2-thiouridine(34) synthase MnmA [Thermoanaerobaculales bacterium]|nr:tRNA 2-thiouridine(34) synthase MnmA [Thermoanaerobaculales bacterium]